MKKRENVIRGRIEELDSKICNEVCLAQNILSEYEKLKKELQEIYEGKGRGAVFRSKARWTENGENPTKYFLTLKRRLSHNYKSSRISLYQIYKLTKK